MTMRNRWKLFGTRALAWPLGAALAIGIFADAGRRPAAADPGTFDAAAQKRVAQMLARRLPLLHLRQQRMDETLGARAFERLFDQLDRQRYFFLASDIEAFREQADGMIDALRDGDVSMAFRVFERFRERVADRTAFVDASLEAGLPEDLPDTFAWRREEASWPEDRVAWDLLWRLRLQNELITRRVAVALAAEEGESAAAEDGDEPELMDPHLTPEAFVRNRHRQFQIVLEDSDEQWILDRFYNAFSTAMDPHSEYLSPARSEDFDINMRLSLFGIGALLSSEDGAARVVRLIPGGPAERDGRLQPGDRIVAVTQADGERVDVLHWPLYRIVRLIRGERGTRVVLTLWPASDLSGATETRIALVRDEVRLEERAARSAVREVGREGETEERRLGIITLPDFYADFRGGGEEPPRRSARDVRALIVALIEDGVDGMLLDLRNNGGGSLSDAVEIAGLFLDAGPIVQVRDRRRVHVINDPDPSRVYEGPLVILVNRMSASASEIVAAALQDYRRAVIVGDSKTHGKGTVQTLVPLDPGDASLGSLKVTTAAFYRVAGGSTQKRGVEPDLVIRSAFDVMEIGEEYLPHALEWTVVPPAFYATMDGDVPPLDLLREWSATRREGDARFREREALLVEIERRQREDSVPLDFDRRLDQARRERTLRDARQADPGAPRPEGDEDLVLEEALRILADIAAWREAQPAEVVPVAAAPGALP